MNIFIYDNTFEGLLTVVFESFRMKIVADTIVGNNNYQTSLLDIPFEIKTDVLKAERVWKGIKKKANNKTYDMIIRHFFRK